MKITKERLKTIIMEELTRAMNEMDGGKEEKVQAAIEEIRRIIAGYKAAGRDDYWNIYEVLSFLGQERIEDALNKAKNIGDEAVIAAVMPLGDYITKSYGKVQISGDSDMEFPSDIAARKFGFEQ